jgi:hypothetical protein
VLFPPRNLPLFGLDELLQDPSTSFVVPSYVKAQTWALASLPSFLSWIISHGYDPRFRSYFDEEALKDV